jgi:hypothetical protein
MMSLSKEANEIRSEVQSLRKGPGRKYSKASWHYAAQC